MNELIRLYRGAAPKDQRGDEEVLLEFGARYPELLNRYPDAKAQYDELQQTITDAFSPKPSLPEEFSRGVKRATDQLQGTGYNALALGSVGLSKIGLPTEKLTQSLLEKGQEQEVEAGENPATVPGWEKADTLSKKVRFMVGGAGEVLPSAIEALVTATAAGAIGAVGGSAAPGPGTLAGGAIGAVAGFIEKQAAKALIKKGIASYTKSQLAKETAVLSAKYAANLATAVNSYALSAGEIYGDLANDKSIDPDKAFNTALGFGAVAGAADTVLPSFLVSKYLTGVPPEKKKEALGYITRLVSDAAKTMPMEAGTEGFQELVNIGAKRYASGKQPVFSGLSESEQHRVINASILGGIGGGMAAPLSAISGGATAEEGTPDVATSPTPAVTPPPLINPAAPYRLNDEEKAKITVLATRATLDPINSAAEVAGIYSPATDPQALTFFIQERARQEAAAKLSEKETSISAEEAQPERTNEQDVSQAENEEQEIRQVVPEPRGVQLVPEQPAVQTPPPAPVVNPAVEAARRAALTYEPPATITGSNVQQGTAMPAEVGEVAVGVPSPAPVVPTVRESRTVQGWQKFAAEPDTLISLVGFGESSLTKKDGGRGKKAAEAFTETDSREELYKDRTADANDKNSSRKLGVFLSPDGSHVLVGTAYKNGTGDAAFQVSGAKEITGSTAMGKLQAAGYKLIASIKTSTPTKGLALTYSPQQWQAISADLKGQASASRRTAEAMATQIEAGGYQGGSDGRDLDAELTELGNEEAAATTEQADESYLAQRAIAVAEQPLFTEQEADALFTYVQNRIEGGNVSKAVYESLGLPEMGDVVTRAEVRHAIENPGRTPNETRDSALDDLAELVESVYEKEKVRSRFRSALQASDTLPSQREVPSRSISDAEKESADGENDTARGGSEAQGAGRSGGEGRGVVGQTPIPESFDSIEDVLEFRRQRIEEEIGLYQKEIGLSRSEAEKLQRIMQKEGDTSRFEKAIGPEKAAKFEYFIYESEYNKVGGPWKMWDYDVRLDPEEVNAETDPDLLAAALVASVGGHRGQLEISPTSDRFIAGFIAAKRLQELGATLKDVSRYVSNFAQRESNSQGDAKEFVQYTAKRIGAFLSHYKINLQDEAAASQQPLSKAGLLGSDGVRLGPDSVEPVAVAVEQAAAKTDTAPTDEQKESGDYDKGEVEIEGLEISIETPRGATRSGQDKDGKPWSVTMPAHYGEVIGTSGKDGDPVDIYIGPNPDTSPIVFVVDQINPETKKFDEHKVLLGFQSKEQALAAYAAAFSDGSGPARIGEVTPMAKEDFVDWINEGETTQPLSYGRKIKASLAPRFRVPESSAETRASAQTLTSAYYTAVDSLRAAGIDVQLLTVRIGEALARFGRFDAAQNSMTLALSDATNPDLEDFVYLLHEAGHAVFAGESPTRQAAMTRALRLLEVAGFKATLDPRLTNEERAAVAVEEQIVEATAQALAKEGFNPAESQSFAQAIWRWIKDIYLRVSMAIQESRFGAGAVQPETASAYFENRLRALLAGDYSMSLVSWLGGPKPTQGQATSRLTPRSAGTAPEVYDVTADEMIYREALPDSLAAIASNSVIRFRPPEPGLEYRQVGSDFPIDDVQPKQLKGGDRMAILKEAGETMAAWPKFLDAADGSRILLQNPDHGSMAGRVQHLTYENKAGVLNPVKARWLPAVPDTIANAAIRLVDPVSFNRIYVRGYAGGQKHMVIVAPDGRVEAHKPFTGKLITQFQDQPPSRQGHMMIDWVRKMGAGSEVGRAVPIPSSSTPQQASWTSQSESNQRANIVKYRPVSFVTDQTEVSTDVDSTALTTRDVAAQNSFGESLLTMFNQWEADGHNAAGLTFDQFVASGSFVRIEALPADAIAALNNGLTTEGLPPVNPATRFANIPSEATRKQSAAMSLQLHRNTWTELSIRRTEAERSQQVKSDRLTSMANRLNVLTSEYTNADRVMVETKDEIRELLNDYKSDARGLSKLGWRLGSLSQTIREIEGNIDTPLSTQYEKAIDRLYQKMSGDVDQSRKFFDVMQAAANVSSIDWENDSAAEIKSKLVDAAITDRALGPVVNPDVDNRAVLAVLVAFGRSNAHVMDLLQLRLSSATAERAAVNTALKKALEDTRSSITEARQMVSKLPNLSKKANRLLQRIKKLKVKHKALFDDLHRDRNFIEFHHSAAPLLRAAMVKLEAQVGAFATDWEPNHNAKYYVPTGSNFDLTTAPGGKLVPTGGTEKTLLFTDPNRTPDQMRAQLAADLKQMRQWLDAVPADKRGAVWADTKQRYDKLGMIDASFRHSAIRGSVVNRIIGSLTDRLDYVGTPLARQIARRFRRQLSLDSTKLTVPIERAGIKWAAAEGDAMKAVGAGLNQEQFRKLFHDRAWKFIETRQDLSASSADQEQAFNRVLLELQRYLARDPETAALMSRPGAWKALERYYRLGAEANKVLGNTSRELGVKVKDGTAYRDPIGNPNFTVMRGLRQEIRRVYDAMLPRWSGVAAPKLGGWVAEGYATDPDQLRADVAARFTPDVLAQFARPMVYRTGRSLFLAPYTTGLQRLAGRDKVISAYEASGGDMVAFAERLFAAEGGTGDPAAFVAETLSTFQAFFDSIHGQFSEMAESERRGLPVPARQMMDARKSEDYPAEWLEYYRFDPHEMRQTVRLWSYESAFGRDMAGVRSDFDAAIREQEALALEYQELVNRAMQSGKKGRALREAVTTAAGSRATQLKEAELNSKTLRDLDSQFTALLKTQTGLPMELKWWSEAIRTVAALTVQGLGTALVETVSLVEQPLRKLGLGTASLRQFSNTGYSLALEAMGTLFQTFGVQLKLDADYMWRRAELGANDLDAGVKVKERMAAILNDESVGPVTRGARLVRAFLNTGIGQGQFDTAKPQALFTQFSKWCHTAAAYGLTKNVESMVQRGVDHFNTTAGRMDMADPAFRFTPKQLGMSEKAADYFREALARFGFDLETVTREATERKAINPLATLLTGEQVRALATLATNEITMESNITTRPPGFITNPVLHLAAPLVGWGIQKSNDAIKSFREADGATSGKAFRSAMLAYTAILPLGLAYAWLRDEYDEELLGKKSNVMRYGEGNLFLTTLDKLGRVGTFGVFGDVANSTLNQDTNREFSVDTRVFFVSSLLAAKNAAGNWIRQGSADWATVWRPLGQALGGNGYLQYANILNHTFGLNNQEAKVVGRISVGNYLRAAGRELNMDVRTGKGQQSVATPTKPYVGQMVMAAYANDAQDFRESYLKALAVAREEGKPKPEEFIARSYGAYHPLRSVFKTMPRADEYARMLATMTQDGRVTVQTAIKMFNSYGEQIGASTTEGRVTPLVPKFERPKLDLPQAMQQARRMAMDY